MSDSNASKEEITFKWDGCSLVLEYRQRKHFEDDDLKWSDVFHVVKVLDPNKMTASTRKRFWAYVLINEWCTQESESWYESGYGYDVDEYTYFIPLDDGQVGSFDDKRHLLYLLMDEKTNEEYYQYSKREWEKNNPIVEFQCKCCNVTQYTRDSKQTLCDSCEYEGCEPDPWGFTPSDYIEAGQS